MTKDTAIHAALIEKVAEAMREMSSVPPANARALLLAAATFLAKDSPLIKASPAELARSANLSDAEFDEAIEALKFINAVMDEDPIGSDDTDDSLEELFLHPDLAWRGDPSLRLRYSNHCLNLMLL